MDRTGGLSGSAEGGCGGGAMFYPTADHGCEHLDVRQRADGDGHGVVREDHEVRVLAARQASLHVLLEGAVCGVDGEQPQRLIDRQSLRQLPVLWGTTEIALKSDRLVDCLQRGSVWQVG